MEAASFGPADLYVIAFPDEHIPEPVTTSLLRVLADGVITLLDLTVIRRTDDGRLDVLEVDVLGDEIDLTTVQLGGSGLVGQDDLDQIAESVPAGSSALVVLLEHTWARSIAAAVRDAGATVVATERFPAAVVNEVAESAGLIPAGSS